MGEAASRRDATMIKRKEYAMNRVSGRGLLYGGMVCWRGVVAGRFVLGGMLGL